jgi:pimeloyl-ACP methyl ester carboxylesterase
MQLPLYTWGDPTSTRHALLVHGLNGSAHTWDRFAVRLVQDGWHVTAVDLRGHASAAAGDDYALASYAADLPRHDWDLVVGHSLGGASSLLAARTPGFAQRLVLLDPVLEIDPDDRDTIIADQIDELALTIESLTAAKPHWHAADIASKVEGARRSSVATARGSFDDNPDWNVVVEASTVAVPTLILGGDPTVYTMLAPATATAIATANAHVTYTIIEGAGHSPQRDRFEETLAALRAWL